MVVVVSSVVVIGGGSVVVVVSSTESAFKKAQLNSRLHMLQHNLVTCYIRIALFNDEN